ncbi:MAG: alginate lyase family protein [Burkholderiaceae bacterium]|nr:alginate lyase family protein [Burkholderiaceae bacterium]
MTPLSLYCHTLRWLKPVQIWGRAWFRLHRPRPDTRPAPPLRPSRGAWVPCRRTPSMTGPARFRFLSVERELAAPADWNRADWPRLWRYNLHYFDDLAAEGAADRASWHCALIERWIADNPPGRGTGWEPYPVSLRIVNWIKWGLADGGGPCVEQARLSPAAVHSLAVQARWLRGRVERHLLGNHLWANAKALVFAGAFFDVGEAARWRDEGLALLHRELREQILPDGGHFERSPMYHATLLEDLLDLMQLAARWPGLVADPELAPWRATAQRMLRWLRVMTHPDGGIAFFNDAAFEVAPDLAALEDYAANACGLAHASDASFGDQGSRVVSLPEPEPSIATLRDSDPSIAALPDSGYVRLQAGPAVLIADVGAIGPDYLPGHAHADTLAFELSLHGRRAIVNSGTSTYEADAERLRQRGTAAHNTVVVDSADSSEVWSSFRVARRARPMNVQWGSDPDGTLWLRAAHDGYLRLPGKVIHHREWRLRPGSLRVVDRLEGRFASAEARFHLHPDADPRDLGVGADSGLRIEASTWHPRFGVSEPNRVLVADFSGRAEHVTEFRWPVAG